MHAMHVFGVCLWAKEKEKAPISATRQIGIFSISAMDTALTAKRTHTHTHGLTRETITI